jgi:predicted secreted protein
MLDYVVTLNPGQVVDVAVHENGSTGYLWDLSGIDPSVAIVTQRTVPVVPDGSIGGGHVLLLQIRGVSPGLRTASYRRPWENGGEGGTIFVTVSASAVETPLVVRARKEG